MPRDLEREKSNSDVLKLNAVKEGEGNVYIILKAKSREGKEKSDNCQAFITWHPTSQVSSYA
jgi:hypothetical protein